MADKTILYIKGEKNTEVARREVRLGDILTLECQRKDLVNRLSQIRILRIPEQGPSRVVVSVLKIISCIQEVCPGLDIRNEGETDFIVTYAPQKAEKMWSHWLKAVLTGGITFLGAAFSIMSFNNDVNLTGMFSQIYELLTGRSSDGFTILELTYSIGLAAGILIFFNHFGRKKFSVDPTPMEVEMRLYETDMQDTLINSSSRKGKELDGNS